MGLYLNEKWIHKEEEIRCTYCGKKADHLKDGMCNECLTEITSNNHGV